MGLFATVAFPGVAFQVHEDFRCKVLVKEQVKPGFTNYQPRVSFLQQYSIILKIMKKIK